MASTTSHSVWLPLGRICVVEPLAFAVDVPACPAELICDVPPHPHPLDGVLPRPFEMMIPLRRLVKSTREP